MHTPSVFIVGGGPAGAAVSLALARGGLSPVLLEAQPAAQTKVGESLPPGVNRLLDELGLADRLRRAGNLRSHGNRFLWGSDALAERDFIYGTGGTGWRLDRRSFEAELAGAAAEAGVDWRYNCRLAGVSRDEGGGWKLKVETPEGIKSHRADFVVDASGRSARLSRLLGARLVRYDSLVGVAAYFETRAGADCHACVEDLDSFTLVEAVASGWWYSAWLPGGKLIAVYMTDGDLLDAGARVTEGWLALLGAAKHTARRVDEGGGGGPPSSLRVQPAHTSRLTNVAGEGWLAVGDAAVAHDPLASHGITMALGSGLHAAHAILEYLGGRRGALREYASLVDRAFAHYLLMRHERYLAERRWPREPFWRRRHAPSPLSAASETRGRGNFLETNGGLR